MVKVLLPALSDSDPRVVRAARSLVDFMYLAHAGSLTDEDIGDMEDALLTFHQHKDVFQELGAVTTDKGLHGIPKLHMIWHYTHLIRELGTPDGYKTETSERLHIDFAKMGYRASNRINATKQMALYIQRLEAIAMHSAYLDEKHRGPAEPDPDEDDPDDEWNPDECLYGDEDDDEGDDVCFDEDGYEEHIHVEEQPVEPEEPVNEQQEDEPRQMDVDKSECVEWDVETDAEGKETFYPSPEIVVAKTLTMKRVSANYIIRRHGAADFVPALRSHFARAYPRYEHLEFADEDVYRFDVWSRARLFHPVPPFKPSEESSIQVVRAQPAKFDKYRRLSRPARFDTVFVLSRDNEVGLHRYRPARVRVIFRLPDPGHLAFVELFNYCSAAPVEPTGLYTTNHTKRGELVRHWGQDGMWRRVPDEDEVRDRDGINVEAENEGEGEGEDEDEDEGDVDADNREDEEDEAGWGEDEDEDEDKTTRKRIRPISLHARPLELKSSACHVDEAPEGALNLHEADQPIEGVVVVAAVLADRVTVETNISYENSDLELSPPLIPKEVEYEPTLSGLEDALSIASGTTASLGYDVVRRYPLTPSLPTTESLLTVECMGSVAIGNDTLEFVSGGSEVGPATPSRIAPSEAESSISCETTITLPLLHKSAPKTPSLQTMYASSIPLSTPEGNWPSIESFPPKAETIYSDGDSNKGAVPPSHIISYDVNQLLQYLHEDSTRFAKEKLGTWQTICVALRSYLIYVHSCASAVLPHPTYCFRLRSLSRNYPCQVQPQVIRISAQPEPTQVIRVSLSKAEREVHEEANCFCHPITSQVGGITISDESSLSGSAFSESSITGSPTASSFRDCRRLGSNNVPFGPFATHPHLAPRARFSIHHLGCNSRAHATIIRTHKLLQKDSSSPLSRSPSIRSTWSIPKVISARSTPVLSKSPSIITATESSPEITETVEHCTTLRFSVTAELPATSEPSETAEYPADSECSATSELSATEERSKTPVPIAGPVPILAPVLVKHAQ
ncbi:hypothetical protein RSOLAG22IIIB_10086 [Rhizoctonia solani]|uniref:Uncharacterized protein n=1 Tax=Rhizoctonia solani TaxID=456999 RepID=A0A0K6G0P5_9AGAM|nr:hypothetical protein RSOLAG22IIIB_10086 [Rhizoctonia solani]